MVCLYQRCTISSIFRWWAFCINSWLTLYLSWILKRIIRVWDWSSRSWLSNWRRNSFLLMGFDCFLSSWRRNNCLGLIDIISGTDVRSVSASIGIQRSDCFLFSNRLNLSIVRVFILGRSRDNNLLSCLFDIMIKKILFPSKFVWWFIDFWLI